MTLLYDILDDVVLKHLNKVISYKHWTWPRLVFSYFIFYYFYFG